MGIGRLRRRTAAGADSQFAIPGQLREYGMAIGNLCEDPITRWNTDGVPDNASTPVATISLLR